MVNPHIYVGLLQNGTVLLPTKPHSHRDFLNATGGNQVVKLWVSPYVECPDIVLWETKIWSKDGDGFDAVVATVMEAIKYVERGRRG
jgi:hypothetical protein